MKFPKNLSEKLAARKQHNALRKLSEASEKIDFASNDYLGFSKNENLFHTTHQFLTEHQYLQNGATGSRLISGNHPIYQKAEDHIANFHDAESALIFNSGYDANLGFFSSVPQKGDFIFYDELIHASIRDGIQLSNAKPYKFQHNDFEDLERLIQKFQEQKDNGASFYVVTESVFSMDGDCPNLEELTALSEKQSCYLIVDEAHALGVFGEKGEGLIQEMKLQHKVFARIMTFGKGLGCHGAAILGSMELKEYLINFSRSFIYTTGLSPHSVATIHIAYEHLKKEKETLAALCGNINFFNRTKQMMGLKPLFVRSKSPIQCAIIPGNEKVKAIASALQKNNLNVKPILSPTVPEGQERLRICLHSYNSEKEIHQLLETLTSLLKLI